MGGLLLSNQNLGLIDQLAYVQIRQAYVYPNEHAHPDEALHIAVRRPLRVEKPCCDPM